MLENKQLWNTEDEEAQRVFLPANDFRRFNGGLVASPEIQALWPSGAGEQTIIDNEPPASFTSAIDRLRQ